jgi:hypothetical protein
VDVVKSKFYLQYLLFCSISKYNDNNNISFIKGDDFLRLWIAHKLKEYYGDKKYIT